MGVKTTAAFAFIPPVAEFMLIYASVLLRDNLTSTYGIGGSRIPDYFDTAKRLLAVTPFLLSLFGFVNGVIFLRTKSYKLLTLFGIVLSIHAFFASVLYWPH